MKAKDIIDAWAEIRKTNHTIPDDVLDLMKNSALSKLEEDKKNEKHEITIHVSGRSNVGKSTVIYLMKQKLSEYGFDIDHNDSDYKSEYQFNTIMNNIVMNSILGITEKSRIKIHENRFNNPIISNSLKPLK